MYDHTTRSIYPCGRMTQSTNTICSTHSEGKDKNKKIHYKEKDKKEDRIEKRDSITTETGNLEPINEKRQDGTEV